MLVLYTHNQRGVPEHMLCLQRLAINQDQTSDPQSSLTLYNFYPSILLFLPLILTSSSLLSTTLAPL